MCQWYCCCARASRMCEVACGTMRLHTGPWVMPEVVALIAVSYSLTCVVRLSCLLADPAAEYPTRFASPQMGT